jgi:hypothetical protein
MRTNERGPMLDTLFSWLTAGVPRSCWAAGEAAACLARAPGAATLGG